MVMPVLAVLASEFPDYSPIWLGLAIGGYGLTQAILQIPMGLWSDKIGRKPVIITGLLLFAAGSLIAMFADTMLQLTIGRLLQGAGAIAGAVMALAADISRENQRSKVMAIIGIAIGFSFYLALILGPVISSHFGLQGLFGATFVLALACIPLVQFVVPSAVVVSPKGDTLPTWSHVKALFKDSQLKRLNLSVMFLHMMITLVFVNLPTRFVANGWELESHWLVYLPILILSIVGMGILMVFSKKIPLNRLLIVSVLLMSASFLLLGFEFNHWLGLMVSVCLFFIAFNFLEANFPALVSNIAPAGRKGSAMGMFASFQFFGAFLGGLLSGILLQYFDADMLYWSAGVLCLLWTTVFLGLNNSNRLKRYTLDLNLNGREAQLVSEQLAVLEGIKEVVVLPEEAAIYLKVEGSGFDLQAAKKLANPL